MKLTRNSLLNLLSTALALGVSSTAASAGTYYFDGGTVDINTNGNGASAGVNGTWNTTLKNWDQGNGLPHIVWNNTTNATDTAVFGTNNTKAVTVSGTVVAGTISVTANGWSFTGGTLDANVLDSNTGGTTSINSNLTGALQIKATGSAIALNSSSGFTINSDNSLSGLTSTEVALNLNSNHLIINHAAALGNASATLNLSKGTLNLGNSAAPNNNVPISYNAWATDLAGTIRGRFSESTWNGAINLTGNSQLMTRSASGVKLILSDTATINLNDKNLSLWSSVAAAGIELNGVISGTGGITTGDGLGALGGSDTSTGTTTLKANNTYTGDTLVNNGTLAITSTGGLKFKIGADDINNKITGAGTGTVTLDGLFTFDLTTASTTLNDSWNIVDVANLTESYGSNFNILGFTQDVGGILWNGTANGATYQFSEAMGTLTVIPEPAAALLGGLGLLTLLRRRRA